VISSLIQSVTGILQYFDLIPSLNNNFKITGTFNNPGPLGIYLSIGFSVFMLYCIEKWKTLKSIPKLICFLSGIILISGIILCNYNISLFNNYSVVSDLHKKNSFNTFGKQI
jgi:hypothetical protein